MHISKFISPFQFSFTKHCSTLEQMLIFIDQTINSPLQKDVIYFDISKAFDTMSHSILLSKLWSNGITGVLWTWCKEYLTNCYQRVSINSYYISYFVLSKIICKILRTKILLELCAKIATVFHEIALSQYRFYSYDYV